MSNAPEHCRICGQVIGGGACLCPEPTPLRRTALEEARAHLGAALSQQAPCDDKIIMDHVRDAYKLLRADLAAPAAAGGWDEAMVVRCARAIYENGLTFSHPRLGMRTATFDEAWACESHRETLLTQARACLSAASPPQKSESCDAGQAGFEPRSSRLARELPQRDASAAQKPERDEIADVLLALNRLHLKYVERADMGTVFIRAYDLIKAAIRSDKPPPDSLQRERDRAWNEAGNVLGEVSDYLNALCARDDLMPDSVAELLNKIDAARRALRRKGDGE